MSPIDGCPTPGPGIELRVHRVIAHDTGIGVAAGFADDRALIEHAAAAEAELEPHVRTALANLYRRVDKAVLEGTKT